MNLQTLLKGLDHPDPKARLQAVRVIGMLDETGALEALARHYRTESLPEVRAAISWAGKRLHEAHKAGYTTLEQIFKHFRIDAAVSGEEDAEEAKFLEKLKHDLDMQTLDDRAGRSALTSAGLIAGGMMLGGMSGMVLGAMAAGMSSASSLSNDAPERGARIPPTAPTATDIRMAVRRLLEDPDARKRRDGAFELGALNNPKALPLLAQAFLLDTHQEVREAAQRAGKLIYWNAIYWQMEQDGSLAREIERRTAPGKEKRAEGKPASVGPAAPPGQEQERATDILRKAQQARSKRQHRR